MKLFINFPKYHPSCKHVKLSEKLIFLTPWYTRVCTWGLGSGGGCVGGEGAWGVGKLSPGTE